MPSEVVQRAKVLLQQLMTKSKSHLSPSIQRESAQDIQESSQVVAPQPQTTPPVTTEISFLEKELQSLEINELTPRQALNLLFAWKKKLQSKLGESPATPQSTLPSQAKQTSEPSHVVKQSQPQMFSQTRVQRPVVNLSQ